MYVVKGYLYIFSAKKGGDEKKWRESNWVKRWA
jgi:hypothetical protein